MDEGLETRPWWTLHLLSWVLLSCVGAAHVVENLLGVSNSETWSWKNLAIEIDYRDNPFRQQHGWPYSYLTRSTIIWEGRIGSSKIMTPASRLPLDKAFVYSYSSFRLAINVAIATLLLLSTTYAAESYLRRQEKWHQFSIQSVLLFTTFVALLLTNAKYDLIRWRGGALWEYIPFFFIAVGWWCMFWTAWRLIGLRVGWIGGDREKDEDQPDSDTTLTLH